MVFQLDFKGPYHNVRMRLRNALLVCDLYVWLISAFWPPVSQKVWDVPELKNLLSKFSATFKSLRLKRI